MEDVSPAGLVVEAGSSIAGTTKDPSGVVVAGVLVVVGAVGFASGAGVGSGVEPGLGEAGDSEAGVGGGASCA